MDTVFGRMKLTRSQGRSFDLDFNMPPKPGATASELGFKWTS
jgi:hypothetical protein